MHQGCIIFPLLGLVITIHFGDEVLSDPYVGYCLGHLRLDMFIYQFTDCTSMVIYGLVSLGFLLSWILGKR